MFTSLSGGNGITSLYSSYSSVFTQLIDDQDALDSQYDILAGSWPKKYNEMVRCNKKLGITDSATRIYKIIKDLVDKK